MDHQAQIDYYEGLLAKHGDSPLALDWNSRESQRLRYEILKELFLYGKKGSGITVLDVGCGFGDLYGYFKAEGLVNRHKISYTGSDISPKILEVARKKYPAAKFELKDILTDRQVPQYDYVFCSGALNIRTTGKEEHLELVKEMIFRMYDLARYGAALNFLGEGMLPVADQDDVNSGRYFFFQPELILSYVRFVCGRYILRHDYHAGDFTVYMLK
ncbi:MAG: class I SAM-dependent methyltransferase [Candidatus Margulisbacteria bacterium]|jgi:SAM-dependent methyltransferase|nr:class I SAM-dependent methyltransferase [Candidatus Margulisiibacteriota bacterium]